MEENKENVEVVEEDKNESTMEQNETPNTNSGSGGSEINEMTIQKMIGEAIAQLKSDLLTSINSTKENDREEETNIIEEERSL